MDLADFPSDLEVQCEARVFARHALSFVRIWDPSQAPGPLKKSKSGAVKIEGSRVIVGGGAYWVEPLDPDGPSASIGVPLVAHIGETDLTFTEWFSPPDEPNRYYGFAYVVSPDGASLTVDVKTGGKEGLSRHVLSGAGVWPPPGTYLPEEGRPGALCGDADFEFGVENAGSIPISLFARPTATLPPDDDPRLCPQIHLGIDGVPDGPFEYDLCSLDEVELRLDHQIDPGERSGYHVGVDAGPVIFTDGWIDTAEISILLRFGSLQWNSPGSPFDDTSWGWKDFSERELSVTLWIGPLLSDALTVNVERVQEDDPAGGEDPAIVSPPAGSSDPPAEDTSADESRPGRQPPGDQNEPPTETPPASEQPPDEEPADEQAEPPADDPSQDPAPAPPADLPSPGETQVDGPPDTPPPADPPPAAEPPAAPLTISGVVWHDRNGDAVYTIPARSRGQSEPPVPQATVTLMDAVGAVVAETTTDEFGTYEFADVPAGEYLVEFVAPDGFEFLIVDREGEEAPVDALLGQPEGTPAVFVSDVAAAVFQEDSQLWTGTTDVFRLGDDSDDVSFDAALIDAHPGRGKALKVAMGQTPGRSTEKAEPPEMSVPGPATVPEEQELNGEEAEQ